MSRKIVSALLLALVVALPAASQDDPYRPLAGTYAVTGESLSDPPPGEAKDTHFRIFLTGSAARDLYQAMKVKASPDECTGPNAMSKFDRNIGCTMHDGGKEYECSFAIDLRVQKLDSSHEC